MAPITPDGKTTLVSRTLHQTAPTSATDPLLQLRYEPQPPYGPDVERSISRAAELSLRGMPVICSACKARRDWLLINRGRHVWIRCRCANEWLEPEITRTDFDAMGDGDWTAYPSTAHVVEAHGFDGSFAGMYLR